MQRKGGVPNIPRGGQPPLILVIDDDTAFRETAEALLAQFGYAVTTAESGDAALRAIERELPAIILLDVFMPGMDGFAFLKILRARAIHVPVVVTSGAVPHGDPDPLLSTATALGAAGALRKPFRIQELQRLIAEVAPAIGTGAAEER